MGERVTMSSWEILLSLDLSKMHCLEEGEVEDGDGADTWIEGDLSCFSLE